MHQTPRSKIISPPPASTIQHAAAESSTVHTLPASDKAVSALSLLPLPVLLRSYLISAVSATPVLLNPSLRLLSHLVHSNSPFLQPQQNRFLHFLLKTTLYAHFCAGETAQEVQRTVTGLKTIGFKGVILAYAKEIVVDKGAAIGHANHDEKKDVQAWKEGTLETVALTSRDDHAAVKFSGAGQSAMRQLIDRRPPSTGVCKATDEICDFAKSRGVRLLFDAEQSLVQEGIDQWTMQFQRKYNRDGAAVVYGTYQTYLRSTPATLARHIAIAQREGFTLGVKLVRGAYMASDPRDLFWATKEETDHVYDGIAESLIRRKWNSVLSPPEDLESPALPPTVSLVLATHNHTSVKKAVELRQSQVRLGEARIDLTYAQLYGMADEVSCQLIMAGRASHPNNRAREECLKAYKYVVWGSVKECLTYLLRRAEENRDAVVRAREGRLALGSELRRRFLMQ
ncbi:MAG: hypothetical protein Q9222_000245 [Ikaeria aurantiellina]